VQGASHKNIDAFPTFVFYLIMRPSGLLLLAIFLGACTFQSDEEYFKKIEQPDLSDFSINLFDFDPEDTIYLYGTATFNYQVAAGGRPVDDVIVMLGDQRLPANEGDSFSLPGWALRNGVFPLTIEFATNSGTGSLADQLNVEMITAKKTWIVSIDVNPPSPPTITSSVENGFLKLSWPGHSKPDFIKYVLTKVDGDDYMRIDLLDQEETTWIDEEYVGNSKNGTSYYVTTHSTNGEATDSEVRYDLLDVSFVMNADSTIKATWKRSLFTGTFKEYVITEVPDHEIVITNINDTSRLITLQDVIFGRASQVYVHLNSKTRDLPYYFGESATFEPGIALPTALNDLRVRHNPYLNALTVTEGSKIRVLDDSMNYSGIERDAGAYISTNPYPGNTVYSGSELAVKWIDLETGTTMSLPLYAGTRGWDGTSNGLTYTTVYNSLMGNLGYLYYNQIRRISDGKVLYSRWKHNSTSLSLRISQDGQFLFNNSNEMYRIANDTTELIGVLTYTGRVRQFREDNGAELIVDSDVGNIKIYNSNTLALKRTLNPPEAGFEWTAYDAVTRQMTWTKEYSDKVYIMHIETGQKRMFKAAYNNYTGAYVMGDYLFTRGRYIKVL
jgi:hypothetical protein